MNMEKKEDLRIIKTKRNLYEGLLTIMRKKSFEEIKVSDICREALVNRSTFYDHFSDKYELLNSLIYDLEDELGNKLNENNSDNTAKEYYIKMIELFFDHISENIKIYSSIIKMNNDSIVMDMAYNVIFKNVEKHLLEKNKNKTYDIPPEIISKFYVSGVLNVCLDYINYPNNYKIKDIIHYIDCLLPDEIY